MRIKEVDLLKICYASRRGTTEVATSKSIKNHTPTNGAPVKETDMDVQASVSSGLADYAIHPKVPSPAEAI